MTTWENRLVFDVLGDVRNSNPYFEVNAAGWTGKGGSLVRSTAQFHEGVASGLLTPTGVAATTEAESNSVPVVPLAPYRLTAWVWCAVARNIALNINWFSASAYLSTSSATPVAVAATTWTQLTFTTATAPGTAATATGLVSMTGTPPVGHTLNFDEAVLTNADESGGQWANLTLRIRDQVQPVTLQVGRQNDLAQAEPARLDLLLDNSDDALTYGNMASPYGFWWGPGRKCRLRETVAGVQSTRFIGYLQVATESVVTAGIEQRVAITAVDRLGQLASARPFISTLAEHIIYTGGASLIAYLPLNEASGPTVRDHQSRMSLTELQDVHPGSDEESHPPVHYGAANPIGADDVRGLVYDPMLTTSLAARRWARHRGLLAAPVTAAAGDTVALAVWVNWQKTTVDGPAVIYLVGTTGQLMIYRYSGTGAYEAVATDASGGSITLTTSIPTELNCWRLVAIRLTESTGVTELWIHNAAPITGTISGVPTTANFTTLEVGGYLPAAMVHAQVYYGPGVYTRQMHLDQIAMGFNGLERQTTGDRIRTIAQYAGVPAAELTQVDKGQSVMQAARLAGKDPLTAMRDAERTEQGLLYADGSGNLVFEDRSSLYNI